MKNLVYVGIAVSVISVSCTNNKQIVEVAEKYVSEQICPILPNASVPDYAPIKHTNPIHKVKGTMNQIKLANTKSNFLLDKKKRDVEETQSLNDFKNRIIINDIIQSDINAIEKADAEQGFYMVGVNIKYSNDKYEHFDIVVSRDLKVLNVPIDMSKIDTIVKKVKKFYDD